MESRHIPDKKFPDLRAIDDREHTGVFKSVSLKYRVFLLLLEFALSTRKSIILSNSNMWLKGRELVLDLCKKFNYKVIGVYFDLPEEVLFERAKKSGRSLDVLRTSKDFEDLIINQRERMQPPASSEFDEFIEIKSEQDISNLKDRLIKILS